MPEDQTPVKASEAEKSQNRKFEPSSRDEMLTPPDHVRVVHGHPDAKGRASIAKGGRMGWDEKIIPLAELPGYVSRRAGREDVYLSQNRFHGKRRRIVSLSETTGLWADLDVYRTERWKDTRPEDVAWAVLRRVDDEGLPLPSYILATGRGLLTVWMLDKPLARGALPRWHAAEKYIIRALSGFGADIKAADAARVFRLIGSVNSRSGETVRAIWQSGRQWSFEELCEAVLPWTRDEIAGFRSQATSRALWKVSGVRIDFRQGALWHLRLIDLQKLRKVRFFGPLPEGQRDCWLFLAAVSLGWICPPHVMQREILELGREAMGGKWSDREIMGQMGAAIRRAQAAARGETITWQGETVDPRYRFRTETIVDWLGITPEEMRLGGLNTLVTPEILSERQAEKGRVGGVRSGEARRRANSERDASIIAAHKSGKSQRKIAEELGMSQRAIHHILNRAKQGDT